MERRRRRRRRKKIQDQGIRGRTNEVENEPETPVISFDPVVDLPFDVLWNVFTRVPPTDLVQFRLVNKSWKHLITFPLKDLLRSREDPVVLHHHGLLNSPFNRRNRRSFFSVYNPKRKGWEKRWLPWMWCAYRMVAADGGLLFFLKHAQNHHSVVYNIATQVFKEVTIPYELQSMHKKLMVETKNLLTGILVDKETGDYRLLMAGLTGGITLMYDSRSSLWKISSSIPSSSRQNNGYLQVVGDNRNIVLNDGLYWGFLCFRRWRFSKMVLKFDMKEESWSQAELPASPLLWQFQIAIFYDKVMTMNLMHDCTWPIPCLPWIQDRRIKNLGPEFRVPTMNHMMFDAIQREQRNNGRNYCGEYNGIGFGDKFFHIMRGSRPGVRIAIQNTTTMKHSLLRFWKDTANGNAKCREFWAVVPSFRAQP